MPRAEYKVGDILKMEFGSTRTLIVKIISVDHMSSSFKRPYKRYHYKVLEGLKLAEDSFFEAGCLLWTSHKIKRVPLLRAKLYE